MGRSANGRSGQQAKNHHRCEPRTRPSDHALSDDAWTRLARLDDADRLAVLTRIAVTSFARALRTDRDALDLDRPLDTLGLDPLVLVGIQTELNVMLGTYLSSTGPLGTHTIREVAVDLHQQVRDMLTSSPHLRSPPPVTR